MSKELSPLEAFAKVKDRLEIWDCGEESNWEEYGTGYYECEEELGIIETALKDYQSHENVLNEYGFTIADFREACFLLKQFRESGFLDVEKKDKALKIIIKKKVNVLMFVCYANSGKNGFKMYNQAMENEEWQLTQEEYDLLKEVLL